MPKYTLNYYTATGGAGEPIRLMFALAGVEFTENQLELAGEDWAKIGPKQKMTVSFYNT